MDAFIGYFNIMLTAQKRRSICLSAWHQTSSHHHWGLQIVQTATRSVTRYWPQAFGTSCIKWDRLGQRVIDNAVKQLASIGLRRADMCQSDSIF